MRYETGRIGRRELIFLFTCLRLRVYDYDLIILVSCYSPGESSQSGMFLSTFAGSQQPQVTHVGVAIVRRNKKGKQAPAPPKRTSSFRDSQCDLDPDENEQYGGEDGCEADYYYHHHHHRRENASFDKLDLGDGDYADMSGEDGDEDSEGSGTQSVPDIGLRVSKDGRDRDHRGLKVRGSKSRTYPIKEQNHLGATRFGPVSGAMMGSHNNSKTQVCNANFFLLKTINSIK